ncbi:MAG: Co2+/Mg2+ efflux protein ApaG [Pseudomonadales bacterium]|nr:Co2+/Mg2+ efflux protein ApaG [Pseudomonadales bacterium]
MTDKEQQTSTSEIAEQVKITVESKFEAAQSDTDAKRFVFSYTVTIKNTAEISVQLLSRRWVVTDGNEKQQQIEGDGVIGVQPTIKAHSSYQYSSGAVIETNIGSMFGHYNMITENGENFKAEISAFTLAIPNALH